MIVACDNGFGHTRRSLLLANKIADHGWTVDLLANPVAVKKMIGLYGIHKNVKPVEFFTRTNIEAFRGGNPVAWQNELPDPTLYDIVVSDNLPEILSIRPDTVISGSFLWHRAVEKVHPVFFNETERLMQQYKPLMIACGLFAGPELEKFTRLYKVGLCVPVDHKKNKTSGSDLLIACGKSGLYEKPLRNFVARLVQSRQKRSFERVWIDPVLLPDLTPEWMRKATFDDSMYSRLGAAICRPGVGTLTDCLWYGIRVFCCFEKGNNEMKQNARSIRQHGVGDYYETPGHAFEAACFYQTDLSAKKKYKKALRSINFNGIDESFQILANHIKA